MAESQWAVVFRIDAMVGSLWAVLRQKGMDDGRINEWFEGAIGLMTRADDIRKAQQQWMTQFNSYGVKDCLAFRLLAYVRAMAQHMVPLAVLDLAFELYVRKFHSRFDNVSGADAAKWFLPACRTIPMPEMRRFAVPEMREFATAPGWLRKTEVEWTLLGAHAWPGASTEAAPPGVSKEGEETVVVEDAPEKE